MAGKGDGGARAPGLGSAGHAQDNDRILLQSGSPLPHGAFAMCQLLGMNCATPTDVTFSFTGFAARGV
jgi:glutamine amidotransferase